MMDKSFENKVVIVTGGARDIGGAISVAFGKRGAHVVVNYHESQAEAENVVNTIKENGGQALAVGADVTDWDQAQHLVAEAGKLSGGRIDVLVNNTGGLVRRQSILETDEPFWDWIMNLNVKSTFFMSKAAIPHMPDGGAIVNISSLAARTGGGPGSAIYATAKGAVTTFTRGLAKELASKGIRVNCIEPGFIDNRFHEATPAERREQMKKATLVERGGRSEEVADAVLFLAGNAASFIYGAAVPVNGGTYFV
jgi:3-oxoacyl-[acyl-carrier protein] reductase